MGGRALIEATIAFAKLKTPGNVLGGFLCRRSPLSRCYRVVF